MSGATPSSTRKDHVYVRLMGEGTVVFRPTMAETIGLDTVRLLAPDDYDPEGEEWEFTPGSRVRIERRTLEGSDAYVAVSPVE